MLYQRDSCYPINRICVLLDHNENQFHNIGLKYEREIRNKITLFKLKDPFIGLTSKFLTLIGGSKLISFLKVNVINEFPLQVMNDQPINNDFTLIKFNFLGGHYFNVFFMTPIEEHGSL